jgi:cytochrome c oxidase subunit 4
MRLADNHTLRLWLLPAAVWLALLTLLAITVSASYLPLGLGNGIVSMGVVASKAFLITYFFMTLQSSSALLRLAALAGIFWLILSFSLTFSDYVTRSLLPPQAGRQTVKRGQASTGETSSPANGVTKRP